MAKGLFFKLKVDLYYILLLADCFLGIYVMPNPTLEHPNMFVGIILPRGMDKQLETEFVYALKKFAELRTSDIVERMSDEQRQRTRLKVFQKAKNPRNRL